MTKSIHVKYLLLAIFFMAWPASAPAQEPAMMRPPIPDVLPPEPPDPYTLPPPPQLEWTSLAPKEEEAQGAITPPEDVPRPKEEVTIAPPPPPVIENPIPGGVDPAEIESVKPEVEIWRGESEFPQIPERRSDRLDPAYVTGTAPVWLRAQFNSSAAGVSVWVRPGRGVTLSSTGSALTVSSSGECLVLAQLAAGVARSHIMFYCAGVKTILPVVRASLPTVITAEEETGGGR